MAKSKIKIEGSNILVNGQVVGMVDGRSEVYVHFFDAEGKAKFAARFKYRSPKSSAVSWIKFILSNMTSLQYLAEYNDGKGPAPLIIAENLGYVSPNKKKMLEIQAAADAWKNRPITIVSLPAAI